MKQTKPFVCYCTLTVKINDCSINLINTELKCLNIASVLFVFVFV